MSSVHGKQLVWLKRLISDSVTNRLHYTPNTSMCISFAFLGSVCKILCQLSHAHVNTRFAILLGIGGGGGGVGSQKEHRIEMSK